VSITDDKAIGVDRFAALCNLFCIAHCGEAELTPEQIGDILLYNAYPVVCDHSRLMARAVLAYLGFTTGQLAGDELVREVHAAMVNGKGSLPDGDNAS